MPRINTYLAFVYFFMHTLQNCSIHIFNFYNFITLFFPFLFVSAAARQVDRKLTELQYKETLQKWLRYAPERRRGTKKRKGEDLEGQMS